MKKSLAKIKPTNTRILTVNTGSSSIKFALFSVGDPLTRILEGAITRIGLPGALFQATGVDPADTISRPVKAQSYREALDGFMHWLENRAERETLTAVGYRVVAGGPKYSEPEKITPKMITELHKLAPFDPEHSSEELLIIEAMRQHFPDIPHIACFDTAFHHDMPRVAVMLPIPRHFEAQGLRRYGFHGLSYSFLMKELARVAGSQAAKGRIILAHLGSGASLAAVRNGKSIDTSMGFTPAGGIPMSTPLWRS